MVGDGEARSEAVIVRPHTTLALLPAKVRFADRRGGDGETPEIGSKADLTRDASAISLPCPNSLAIASSQSLPAATSKRLPA